MPKHLDWHRRLAERDARLVKDAREGVARFQPWYWSEEEWVKADDVIFGVQNRKNGATGGSAAQNAADAKSAEAARRASMSVPTKNQSIKQKQCAVSRKRACCFVPALMTRLNFQKRSWLGFFFSFLSIFFSCFLLFSAACRRSI